MSLKLLYKGLNWFTCKIQFSVYPRGGQAKVKGGKTPCLKETLMENKIWDPAGICQSLLPTNSLWHKISYRLQQSSNWYSLSWAWTNWSTSWTNYFKSKERKESLEVKLGPCARTEMREPGSKLPILFKALMHVWRENKELGNKATFYLASHA